MSKVKKKNKIDTANANKSKKRFDLSKISKNWQALILFVIAFLIYSPSIGYEYVLDDALMITENEFTKAGPSGVKDVMTNDALVGFFGKDKNLLAGGRYRPLSQVMFIFEYQVFKGDPWGMHLISIILYAFLAVVVFFFLYRLFSQKNVKKWYLSIPFLASLLFVLHPIHTEVVPNIKDRDEIMAMLASLSAIILIFKYFDNKKILYLIAAIPVYAIALLSKEDSITFFAVLPLCLLVFTDKKIKDYLIAFTPLILGASIYFAFRYNALGFLLFQSGGPVDSEILNNPYLHSSKAEFLATNIYTWGKYLILLIFPINLTHDYYPFQIGFKEFSDFAVEISMMVYIALAVFAVIKVFKKNVYAWAILFFLATFSIYANIVMNIGTFMNERFMFIPLLGFTVALAYAINKLSKKINTSYVMVFVVLLSLAYTVKTIDRSKVWKTNFTLFTTDVHTSSNSAKCNLSAGGEYYKEGLKKTNEIERETDFNLAVQYISKAVELHPTYIVAWNELGNVYQNLYEFDKAIECYNNILAINPKNSSALSNIQKANNYDKVFKMQEITLLIDSNRLDEAEILLNEVLLNDTANYQAYSKLGLLYGKRTMIALNSGEMQIANSYIALAEKYLLLAYNNMEKDLTTCENLGIVYGMAGQIEKSLLYFNEALSIEPDNERILTNIEMTKSRMKN